jgi:hypothetical protein
MPSTSRRRSGSAVENIQDLVPETADQALGGLLADALDGPGFEKAADAVQRSGQQVFAGLGLELAAELGVLQPVAVQAQGFARSHVAQDADHRDLTGLGGRVQLGDDIAVFGILVDDADDFALNGVHGERLQRLPVFEGLLEGFAVHVLDLLSPAECPGPTGSRPRPESRA